jgi:glutathione synthase/RimK-type ligase-like ATP-grasp enzyme
MTAINTCWGIYRELAHSPGRVDDDGAIMERVGDALRERGFSVELVAADAANVAMEAPRANIFAMCERGDVLDRLSSAEKVGSIVVNAPNAIRNTYRHRMVELFAQHHISAPASQIVATDARQPRPASAVWVKRYDFHATQSEDVIYVASEEGWRGALNRFSRRGIPFIVAQEHVAGDLIKFYGVRNPALAMDANWFEWFYHRDKGMLGHFFDVSRLRQSALDAAAALGLQVFGGDAIIQANGEPVIIDLNAWPSYARYRDRAAQAIADLLVERFQRRPRIVTPTRVNS